MPQTDQKVLVVGGAGYLGSVLVRKLIDRGYRVRVLDNLLHGDEPILSLFSLPTFKFIRGEIRNIDTIFQAVRDADAVIHLAAIVGDQACNLDPAVSVQVNAQASRVIAEACRFYSVRRLVFASTCSVYGCSSEILTEHSPLNPVSLYAKTKIEAEKGILGLVEDGLSPCILRASTLFGLSPRMRFDLVVSAITARAVIDGEFMVYGGEQWRPFLHVDDAAEAYAQCLEAPLEAIRGQVFNLGANAYNYRIRDIADMVQALVPTAVMKVDERTTDRRDYRVSFDKIEQTLHFHPRKTVQDGIQEVKTALEHGVFRDYRDKKYSNYQKGFDEYYASLLRYDSIDKM